MEAACGDAQRLLEALGEKAQLVNEIRAGNPLKMHKIASWQRYLNGDLDRIVQKRQERPQTSARPLSSLWMSVVSNNCGSPHNIYLRKL